MSAFYIKYQVWVILALVAKAVPKKHKKTYFHTFVCDKITQFFVNFSSPSLLFIRWPGGSIVPADCPGFSVVRSWPVIAWASSSSCLTCSVATGKSFQFIYNQISGWNHFNWKKRTSHRSCPTLHFFHCFCPLVIKAPYDVSVTHKDYFYQYTKGTFNVYQT